MDILSRGLFESTGGTTKASQTKQSGSWEHWCTFVHPTSIQHIHLDIFSQDEKNTIISALAVSVRANIFGKSDRAQILHGTVKTVILDVSATFCAALGGNPTIDPFGRT